MTITAAFRTLRSGHGGHPRSRSGGLLVALAVLLICYPVVAQAQGDQVQRELQDSDTPFPTVTPKPSISPAPSDFPSLAPTGVPAERTPIPVTTITRAPSPAPFAPTTTPETEAPVATTAEPTAGATPPPSLPETPAPVTPSPVAATPVPSDLPSLVPSGDPVVTATEAPVATPSPTDTAIQIPCMICPNSTDMTLPDATFEDFFTNETGVEMTCGDAQDMGDSGTYTVDQCIVLQDSLEAICGCQAAANVTGAPTVGPTAAPVTASPTTGPTTSVPATPPPTIAPTLGPTSRMKDISGEVYITLKVVASLMPESVMDAYERVCSEFFGDSLGMTNPPIREVEATLLQQTKLSTTETTARYANIPGRELRRGLQMDEEPPNQELPPLLTLLRVRGRIMDDADVQDLNQLLVYAVEGDEEGFLQELKDLPNGDGLYFRPVDELEANDPDSWEPPAPAPTPRGIPEDDDDDDLAVVGIIFSIIGGFIILCAVVGAGWYLTKGRRPTSRELSPTDSTPAPTTPREAPPTTAAKSAAVVAEVAPARTPVGPAIKASDTAETSPGSDILPVGLIPPQQDADASSSVMPSEGMGGASLVESSEAGDNMSYTYSLEAGHLDQQTYATGVSGAGAISTLGGDQSTEFSGRPNMVSREVIAPPGKLGIVIDTTLEGPVVHKVNPGSPLDGIVQPGDIIVAIDNVDTRAMSASAITALMVKTANQERRMTVLSEDEAGS